MKLEEAMNDPKITKELGTGGLLTLTLVTGVQKEIDTIQESLMKSEFRIGWDAGYQAGLLKGQMDAQRKVQVAMGLEPAKDMYPPSREQMFDEDFTARQEERQSYLKEGE